MISFTNLSTCLLHFSTGRIIRYNSAKHTTTPKQPIFNKLTHGDLKIRGRIHTCNTVVRTNLRINHTLALDTLDTCNTSCTNPNCTIHTCTPFANAPPKIPVPTILCGNAPAKLVVANATANSSSHKSSHGLVHVVMNQSCMHVVRSILHCNPTVNTAKLSMLMSVHVLVVMTIQ